MGRLIMLDKMGQVDLTHNLNDIFLLPNWVKLFGPQ